MKKYLILSLFCFSFLFASSKKEIEISLICGYGDAISSEGLIEPVLVSVKNNSEKHFKGYIDLQESFGIMDFGDKRTFRQDLVLPANSHKLFKYHARLTSKLIRVIITTETERFVFDKECAIIKKNLPMWINWKTKLSKNKNVESRDGNYLQVDTPIQMFPANTLSLNRVTVMYFDEIRKFSLDTQQKQILKKWVALGGIAIFASSLGLEKQIEKATSLIVVPATIEKSYSITKIGAGRIICFVEADGPALNQKYFRNQDFVENILLHEKNKEKNNVWYDSSSSYLRKILQSELVGEIDYSWMLILLVAYLFCIGPLDYLITRKSNNRMLTWWIYIFSIVFFSILVYIKGYVMNSGPMKQFELNFVDVCSSNELEGHTVFGVYSTRNANYTIKCNKKNACFFPLDLEQSSDLELFSTEERNLKTRIPIYSSKNYVCTWQSNVETYSQKLQLTDGKIIHINVPKNATITKRIVLINGKVHQILVVNKELWSVVKTGKKQYLSEHEQTIILASNSKYKKYARDSKNLLFDRITNRANQQIVLLFFETEEEYISVTGENLQVLQENVFRYIFREE